MQPPALRRNTNSASGHSSAFQYELMTISFLFAGFSSPQLPHQHAMVSWASGYGSEGHLRHQASVTLKESVMAFIPPPSSTLTHCP